MDNLRGYPLVAADKDLFRYNNTWKVYDLVRDYAPSQEDIARILWGETSALNIKLPGLDETIWTIAQEARIPFYHSYCSSVYQAKLLLTMAVVEGIRRKKEGEELYLSPQDVLQWKDKTYLLPGATTDDFHCEYIIYDGTNLEWDPLVKFNPSQLFRE